MLVGRGGWEKMKKKTRKRRAKKEERIDKRWQQSLTVSMWVIKWLSHTHSRILKTQCKTHSRKQWHTHILTCTQCERRIAIRMRLRFISSHQKSKLLIGKNAGAINLFNHSNYGKNSMFSLWNSNGVFAVA